MERPAQGIESRGLARVGDRLRRGHSAELRRLRNSDDSRCDVCNRRGCILCGDDCRFEIGERRKANAAKAATKKGVGKTRRLFCCTNKPDASVALDADLLNPLFRLRKRERRLAVNVVVAELFAVKGVVDKQQALPLLRGKRRKLCERICAHLRGRFAQDLARLGIGNFRLNLYGLERFVGAENLERIVYHRARVFLHAFDEVVGELQMPKS